MASSADVVLLDRRIPMPRRMREVSQQLLKLLLQSDGSDIPTDDAYSRWYDAVGRPAIKCQGRDKTPRNFADFADPRRRQPGWGRGRYSTVASTSFLFIRRCLLSSEVGIPFDF